MTTDQMTEIEQARANLKRAQQREHAAMRMRSEGKITKSCHREHVQVTRECAARVREIEARMRREAHADKEFLTVYPEGWFGRSPKAKMHACVNTFECDDFGNAISGVSPEGKSRRVTSAEALCGAVGTVSGNEFKATVGDVLTCSRCAAKVAKAKAAA